MAFTSLPNAVDLARALADRCRTWSPGTRLIADLRVEDLAELADWVAALPEAYLEHGDLAELVDRRPNGLSERMFTTAAVLHHCAHAWAPEAPLVQRAEPEWGMTDPDDPGLLAGDLCLLADFVLLIPRADVEEAAGKDHGVADGPSRAPGLR